MEELRTDRSIRNPNWPPRFLLVGHVGSQNRGCEALVRTTIDFIREDFPNATFTLASWSPENDGPLAEIADLRIVPGRQYSKPMPVSQRLIRRMKREFSSRFQKVLHGHRVVTPKTGLPLVSFLSDEVEKSDIVMSIGGDNYSEYYGVPEYFLQILELAQTLKRRSVIWGATIGPFSTPAVLHRAVETLNHTELITARDEWTIGYLKEIGVNTSVVRVSDSAYFMPSRESLRTRMLWPGEFIIGFNGSGILQRYTTAKGAKTAIDEIVIFLRRLVDKQGHKIILVPQETTPGFYDSDWPFLFHISNMIARPNSVYLLRPGLDAQETKYYVGQCRLFLGMRLHAIVSALSQHIPTIGFSYSPKFVGIMLDACGRDDLLLDYNCINNEDLEEKYNTILRDEKLIRNALIKRLPNLRGNVRNGVKAVRILLSTDSINTKA